MMAALAYEAVGVLVALGLVSIAYAVVSILIEIAASIVRCLKNLGTVGHLPSNPDGVSK